MALEGFVFGSNEGSLFVQPDGPNTKPEYLGCHDFGELDEPLGDAALWQCRDPNRLGGWQTSRVVKGGPGLVTTSITTDLRSLPDFIEELPDNVPLYVCAIHEGKPNSFDSYTRAFASRFLATNRQRSNLAMGRGEESPENTRAEQVIELSGAPPVLPFFDLASAALRISIAETAALNNLVFTDDKCTEGFATADGTASPANVLTAPTWAAAAAQPFDANEDIVGGVAIPLTKNTERWIVARGTTDAGAPAEIGYSDDGGANWTNVNVGSQNGTFTLMPGALFALDQFNIWMATDDGYIYKSEDGGLSWTAQEKGIITANGYNAIYFKDAMNGMAVGPGDVASYTNDGGITWAAVTAPGGGNDLTTVGYSGFWWTGDDGGLLYYSSNNGANWDARQFSGSGTGAVRAVKFANELFGVLAHNTAAPLGRLLVTINGGFSWVPLTIPTNAGINNIWICSTRKIYAVGEASGGTGFLMKVEV